MAYFYRLYNLSQCMYQQMQKVVVLPLQQIYRKEIGAARMPGSTIKHVESIAVNYIRRHAFWLLHPP